MTNITVWDEMNVIAFGEGCLPSMEQLRAACPKRPSYLYANLPWHFSTRDEALAWTLSAIARREVDHAHRGETAGRVELDTWVLTLPTRQQAEFAAWFNEKRHDYRVVVQRQALEVERQRLNCCIGYAPNLPLQKQSNVAREKRDAVKMFLNCALVAYRKGYPSVIELMQSAGHPYVYSSGLPLHR